MSEAEAKGSKEVPQVRFVSPIRSLTEEERNLYSGACLAAVIMVPAFRDGVALLRPFYDVTAQTAYTDRFARVGLSPWFFEELTPARRASVILHEVLHVLNGHFTRFDNLTNVDAVTMEGLNVAGDMEINTGLSTLPAVDLREGVYPEKFPFHYDKFLSMEKYYDLLQQDGHYKNDCPECAQEARDTKDKLDGGASQNSDDSQSGQSSQGDEKNQESSQSGDQGDDQSQSGQPQSGDQSSQGDQGQQSQGGDQGQQSQASGGDSSEGGQQGQGDDAGQGQNQGGDQGSQGQSGDQGGQGQSSEGSGQQSQGGQSDDQGGQGSGQGQGDAQNGQGQGDAQDGQGSGQGGAQEGQGSGGGQNQGGQQGGGQDNLPRRSRGGGQGTLCPRHAHEQGQQGNQNGQPDGDSQGQGGQAPGSACDAATEERSAGADAAGVERASQSEQAVTKKNTMARVKDERQKSLARGDSHMSDFLDIAQRQMAPPKVSWKNVLRSSLARMNDAVMRGNSNYSYRRVNRRRSNDKILFPGMITYIPKVMFAVDTSGSMQSDDYHALLNELEGILKSTTRKGKDSLRMFSVDTQVEGVQPVKNLRDVKFRGGGGTDMSVAVDYVNELGKREVPDIFVLSTDGGTDWRSYEESLRAAKGSYKHILLVTNERGYSTVPESLKRLCTVVDVSDGASAPG